MLTLKRLAHKYNNNVCLILGCTGLVLYVVLSYIPMYIQPNSATCEQHIINAHVNKCIIS